MTLNICGGIYTSDSSPDLACGPEVSWLPPIMNAFPEGQSNRRCLSFQPLCRFLLVQYWGQATQRARSKSCKFTLSSTQTVSCALCLSLFLLHACIHTSIHPVYTFAEHLLYKQHPSGVKGMYTPWGLLGTMAKWRGPAHL